MLIRTNLEQEGIFCYRWDRDGSRLGDSSLPLIPHVWHPATGMTLNYRVSFRRSWSLATEESLGRICRKRSVLRKLHEGVSVIILDFLGEYKIRATRSQSVYNL